MRCVAVLIGGFMDKRIAGLLAGVAGLATMSAAQAAIQPASDPAEALKASSYADLLSPIPDAVALLEADNAARAQPAAEPAEGVQLAQAYYYPPYSYPYYNYHRHHHHHNNYYGRYYRQQHHHHHHQGAFVGVPGVGGVVIGGR
jgi:hypothetical protein